jgi:hypothetical protein
MTQPNELTIHIPIGDWQDEVSRAETIIKDKDDVIKLVCKQMPTGHIARAVIVNQELGLVAQPITRSNKLLLYTGAFADIACLIRARHHLVAAPNGCTYAAPDFIGTVTAEESEADAAPVGGSSQTAVSAPPMPDEPPTYIGSRDAAALDRATRYLLARVPGHIWPRLLTIYENGGNVTRVTADLKATIDELTSRLR